MKKRICFTCHAEYTDKRCPACVSRVSEHKKRERQNKAEKCRKLARFCRNSYTIKHEISVVHDLIDEATAEEIRRNIVREYKERLRFYG